MIVHTISLTAADFGEFNPPAVLTFTSTQQRACANIVIIDDNIIEQLEFFTVTLSSTNFQVNILIRNALVIIADNDGNNYYHPNIIFSAVCYDGYFLKLLH